LKISKGGELCVTYERKYDEEVYNRFEYISHDGRLLLLRLLKRKTKSDS
jgi:hypothetical protein